MGYSRDFVVTRHSRSKDAAPYTRRYAALDNAVPRTIQIAMREGRVGDVFEVHHAVTGTQLGYVKVPAAGDIEVHWIWEQKYEPRAKTKASGADKNKAEPALPTVGLHWV
jgi:hypothetical protein